MELPKMWLIQLVLMFCCFKGCMAYNCVGVTESCSEGCRVKYDYSFFFQRDINECGKANDDYEFGRGEHYYACKGNNCNGGISSKADVRRPIKCYVAGSDGKFDKIEENCKACYAKYAGNQPTEKTCDTSAKGRASDHGGNSNDFWYACYGDLCNTEQKRKCYVGEYGDCSWTRGYDGEKFGLEKKSCDQWHAPDICVLNVWTHVNDSSKVCHKYRCHHYLVNHGEELIFKQLKKNNSVLPPISQMNETIKNGNLVVKQCLVNVTKNCFNVTESQKISCYNSSSEGKGNLVECGLYVPGCRITRVKSTGRIVGRGCSPSNTDDGKKVRCYDKGTDQEICDFKGNATNDQLEKEKHCWTGIEGDCKQLFGNGIDQVFHHKPVETLCKGWNKRCYKMEFTGGCTWYNCDMFQGNNDWPQFANDTATTHYTKDSVGTWNITHTRCSGENCNTPKDSAANDLGSNLMMMLLAIGLLNVLV